MPKCDVPLKRTVTELMQVVITAKDEDTAREKIDAIFGQCDYAAEKIAKHCKDEWSIDDEEFAIEDITQIEA